MLTDKKINWGILGCGKIAAKFAEDLRTISRSKLVAVASRNIEKAKNFGNKFEAKKCYASYKELCEDSNIDIIYIATPHVFHFEHTMLCLEHKKAVLCEKPFGMNTTQVKKMIAKAKEKDVFLMEAMWTCFLPHYQYVLEMIYSKELGEIRSLKADFGYQFEFDPNSRVYKKELGGGSLLDIGIYPLFAAISMIGNPENISANAILGQTGVDEECSMTLDYKNGVRAQLFSSVTKETKTEATIEFEKGTLIIHSRFHEPTSITIFKGEKKETKNFDVQTNGYNFEAEHVQEMLFQQRKESTIMTFDMSLKLIHLLDSVRSKIGLYYKEDDINN